MNVLPDTHPLMVAWAAFRASGDYARIRSMAPVAGFTEDCLRAAFVLGFEFGTAPQEPAKPSGGQQDLERNLSMTNAELIEQALSHPPLSQPPRAGRREEDESADQRG